MSGRDVKTRKSDPYSGKSSGEIARALTKVYRSNSPDAFQQASSSQNGEIADGQEHEPVILIVDDDAILRDALARALKQKGFSAIGTGDGQTAVDLCVRLKPVVVLLDLSMPNFNGPQVLKELKQRMGEQHTPVIWITGSVNPENLDHMGGALACIGKPFHVDQITEIVNRHIRR
jgi:two-component system, OmpR family, response regulator AdeR